MEFYVKISFISIFSLLFLVSTHDLIKCVDFTRIAASTELVMTSQIRSHIEYLILTYCMLLLIL